MNTTPSLVLAGRPVRHVEDSVRRYCGLPWSGGVPEVWAYAYYDAVPTPPDSVEPADVTAAAALHPGLSREDLSWFIEHRERLEAWLAACPSGVALTDADDGALAHLESLVGLDSVSLALLTKVLHRKRPALIPLVDRRIVDWYRPITGERNPERAWPRLLLALRADLRLNADALRAIGRNLEDSLSPVPSALRTADIAIWMGGAS